MIDVIKESSLTAALSAAPLTSLPKVWDGSDDNGFWIRAVCLVLKRDLSQSYTLAVRDAHGKIRHIRDFGHIGMISRVLSIYPYDVLDEQQYCQYGTPQSLYKALHTWYGDSKADEIISLNDEEQKVYIREIGIAKQIDAERNGTFISTEEREIRRREREEVEKAKKEALLKETNVARIEGENAVFSYQVVNADNDKLRTFMDGKNARKKQPRKTK